MRLAFTILLLLVLSNNTFSPQYLIWLAPFVAFLSHAEARLFIVASVLTWTYFRYWEDVVALSPMAASLLIVRNALLVILLLIALYNLFRQISTKLRNGSRVL